MEDAIFIRAGVAVPRDEISFTASRSGGPGGQHVNTTSSRVTLHWDALNSAALSEQQRAVVMTALAGRINVEGVFLLHADSERSQLRNKEIALERFVELLRAALAPKKPRVATRASRGSKRRRLESKAKRGALKRDRRRPDTDG